MFKLDAWTIDYQIYSDEILLPSHQTARIEISVEYVEDIAYCGIYFVIYHKRRQICFTDNHITGKDGVLGLLWAKTKLIEFEEWIDQDTLEFDKTKKYILYCHWTDSRRKKVYERTLSKLGFTYRTVFGKKALSKVIFQP